MLPFTGRCINQTTDQADWVWAGRGSSNHQIGSHMYDIHTWLGFIVNWTVGGDNIQGFRIKFFKGKRLFTGTVPVNKKYLTGTVPVNKKYLTGTVPVNKKYLTGTVIRVGD